MMRVKLEGIYKPATEILARRIDQELILVSLAGGVGNPDDEIFSLNHSGEEIWKSLDGEKTLTTVVKDLAEAFVAKPEVIQADVLNLVNEMLERRLLVEVSDTSI